MNLDFEKLWDFFIRNLTWLSLAIFSLLLLSPAKAKIRTFFLVISVECLAIVMSAISVKVFTEIDFTKKFENALGQIFIGVHICVGLTVLGVYIAQFTP
jgi:hypothetical protein